MRATRWLKFLAGVPFLVSKRCFFPTQLLLLSLFSLSSTHAAALQPLQHARQAPASGPGHKLFPPVMDVTHFLEAVLQYCFFR